MKSTNDYRWVILALTLLSTTLGVMVWISAFPFLNLWVRDLGISHTQGGLLSGLGYLPGILVALPSGWLFDRFPLRRGFLLSWSLIVLGTAVMALAPGFLVLCVGRLLLATGANMHMVGAPKMLAAWFEGRKELGLVMGLFSMSMTVGGLGGISVMGKFGNDFGWRAAMQLLTALAVIGLLALALGVRQAHSADRFDAAPSIPFRPFQAGLAVWVLAAGYFFFSIGTDAYLAFTPDYLVTRGYDLDKAAVLVGSYAWASIILKPLCASFLNPRNAHWFVLAGCIVGILSNAVLLQGQVSPLLPSLMIGVALAFALPALFAWPTFMLGSERSGLAYGLYQLFYSLGLVAQTLIGYTIDRTGEHYWGYTLASAYLIGGFVCTLVVRNSERQPNEVTA